NMRRAIARRRCPNRDLGTPAVRTRRSRSRQPRAAEHPPGAGADSFMISRETAATPTAASIVLDDLLRRIQAEFNEMPGLRLTRAQARRLWALDDAVCDAVLTALLDARFLARSGDTSFVRAE